MGRCLFTILGSIAELERELIRERIKCGMANAKAKGKRLGREKSRDSELIRELRRKGCSYREIAKIAKCSIATVNRELSVPKGVVKKR